MKTRTKVLLFSGVVAGAIAITVAPSGGAAAGKSAPVSTGSATTAVSASAKPSQAAAASVTYSCTGTAPEGVDITYGPEGSDYSASSLPFSKTMAVDAAAQYMSVQAQLQGDGQVTCTTSVNINGTSTVQTGTASGGYNLASAELCGDFSGGWDAC